MSGSWVYVCSEPGLWTVGHCTPDGAWHPDSDHGDRDEAAARVAWLNGSGADGALVVALRDAVAYVELYTGNGVQVQPRSCVLKPGGDFDAEKIARNAREALAKVTP